jgi:NADH-quinone oxidoreductase subunit C
MAMSEALDNLGAKIVGGLAGAATGHSIAFGQLTVAVHADRITGIP